MYFDTQLSVVINGQLLTTVVEVKTSNDAQNIGARADIIVPLNSYISYSDPNTTKVYLTAIRTDTFPQGSPITITANYVGYPPIQIFQGYVFDFILGMPLTIKCLDYIYFFNLGIFGDKQVHTTNKAGTKIKNSGTGVNYKSVQFTDLLQQLVAFANTQIDLQNAKFGTSSPHAELVLPTLDMTLVNLTFINMSPASILEYFKKNLGLNISFIGNQLYVNIASNTIGAINLDTGRNVIKSSLQTNLASFQKIRLKCWFEATNGTRNYVEVGDSSGIQQECWFYNVNNVGNTYDILSNAALLQAKQHRYHGKLELLLYPQCDLFYIVNYLDRRYPEKNGQYYIIGVFFELSERGFHREIQVAWLNVPEYSFLKGQTIKSSGIVQT
jgi:hypothetical protein